MRVWLAHAAVMAACLVLMTVALVGPVAAQDAEARPTLVFSTFPSDGMGLLFSRILTEAYDRIGYDVEILSVPAERALVMSNQGECDGEAARVAVIEGTHTNLVRVPTPLYVNTVVAFTKKLGIDPAKGWDVLAPYRLGSVIGYKFIEKRTSGFDRTLVTSYELLFTMLKNDRVDVAVTEYLDVMPSLRGFYFGDIHLLPTAFSQNPMYHYLHKKNGALAPRIDAVLKQMKDEGRMEAILHEMLEGIGGEEKVPCLVDEHDH